MGTVGILKALGAAVMAVSIFYVGGMASLEALSYLGQFDWPIKTAAFWTGGVVLALVLAEMTRRVISDIAAFLEDEVVEPKLNIEAEEVRNELPAKPTARPGFPPPKPVALPARK
ncbi:MAG: hypothetical protein EXQ95_06155 [Alphaproteobacteria bacterium]|nr:hypothetical protein [Alphaproteobacteria bacterium]